MTGAINPKVRLVMRLIIGVFLVVIVNFQIAAAAEISRQYGRSEIGGFSVENVISVDGKIEVGDFKKFMTVLETYSHKKDLFQGKIEDSDFESLITGAHANYVNRITLEVELNSNGGDVIEAMKIGRAIKKFGLNTGFPSTGDPDEKCLSACFFIYVSGVVRSFSFLYEGDVGVHRPYFKPDYFAGLSSTEAEKKHKSMVEDTKQYLRDMNVSEELIDLTYRVPPKELYFITDDDFKKWIGRFQPFFKDWVFAKCDHIEKLTAEEEDDFKNANKRNLSSGYRIYLHSKIGKINDCIWSSAQTEQFRLLNTI